MKKSKKKLKIETKGESPLGIKKYFTLRNILVFVILLIFYSIYPKFVQPIVLIILFYPLALFSTKASKFTKFINTELITSFTIFIGYLYGWWWAFFFGFILGSFMWSQTALNTLTIVNCITYIYAAYFGAKAAIWFPDNFLVGYLIAVTIKNVLTFFSFLLFNPSIVENISHTISEMITNTVVAPVFLDLLYKLIMWITPK